MSKSPLLVIVHPGSLCGSLDMHLGDAADGVRGAIADEIDQWEGASAVITGNFMDELERRECRGLAYSLRRCSYETRGEPSGLGLKRAARRVARQFGLGKGDKVRVTGAWNDNDGSGCVTAVAAALTELGLDVEISENAPASDAA